MILIFTAQAFASGQQNYTLSGKISDIDTGEDLIGVTLFINETSQGVVTNSFGFYSISLPAGRYTIRISHLGYEKLEQPVNLDSDRVLNFELSAALYEISEVVVSSEADKTKVNSVLPGLEKLDMRETEKIPVLFGERDLLKTIQLLPGISGASEGNTGFNVRGGSIGENLILLDDATVYGSAHLAGFFSVFNSDAVKDVTIYKGGIPANYGGRAASVLDITMNNGNNRNFSTKGGIGLISSRLALEFPVIKEKMSLIISGRRTYGDLVAKLLFPEEIVRNDMVFYFYDLNAKLNYTINERNRLFISGYSGKDQFELGSDAGTGWGNTTGTIRWNHLFSDKLFSRTALVYSKYNYSFVLSSINMKMRSGIEDFSLKEDLTWYPNPGNTIKSGIELISHNFNPGELRAGENSDFEIVLGEKRALEGAVYVLNDHKITSRFHANYGIRFSGFSQTGGGWFYNYNDENEIIDSVFFSRGRFAYPYFFFEPRISANYRLNQKSSVKLSYNRLAQYLLLLSNNTVGTPTDVWIPVSNNLKPVRVDHASAGYFRNFMNNTIETSVEVYYKNIGNSSDYEDGADLVLNRHVESQVLTGKGRSYGLEAFLKRNAGKLTGWISYTYSRTENRIQGIDNNSWYPVRYDRTHDLSIVTTYQAGKRLSISGVWVYATGNAVTFPGGKYIIAGTAVPYYTERNGYRMPSYHRLDLSISLEGRKKGRYQSVWDLSVYNVYNRRNAWMITFRESQSVAGTTEAVKLSLFGIVPSISYNFRF